MSNRNERLPSERRVLVDRMFAARISSGIGALAIVIAGLALLQQRDITPLVLISVIIGVVGIALWTVLAPNDLRTLISGRQALYGGNSIFTAVLVIGIVTIVYTLTASSGIAADLTAVRYYSLKGNVADALKNLAEPIQITAFYNSARLEQQAADAPILQMFADAAPDRIKVVVIDPDEQPLRAQAFNLNGPFGIFVSRLTAAGQPDPNGTVQMRGDFAREQWIAEAILQLQARGKFRVLFTTGHGELGTERQPVQANQEPGEAWRIRDGMEQVGIVTATIDLKNQDIPAGTSALVLLRPERDFEQSEVDKIAKFSAAGGKLMIAVEPAYRSQIEFMVPAISPMAKFLWEQWGIRPQNNIVFDTKSFLEDRYRLLAARVLPHKITNKDGSGTAQIRPLLQIAESIEVNPILPANVVVTPLILTSDDAVGKVDVRKVATNPDAPANLNLESGDKRGPLTMMAISENNQTGGRVLLIGDADWAYNDAIVSFDGYLLWTNSIDWLTEYLSNITVQPTIKQLPLIVDSGTLNVVLIITLFVMPGIVLVAGGLVWWDRLRR
jgi:hypothetical protein